MCLETSAFFFFLVRLPLLSLLSYLILFSLSKSEPIYDVVRAKRTDGRAMGNIFLHTHIHKHTTASSADGIIKDFVYTLVHKYVLTHTCSHARVQSHRSIRYDGENDSTSNRRMNPWSASLSSYRIFCLPALSPFFSIPTRWHWIHTRPNLSQLFSGLLKIHQSPDFDALKLWKDRSGRQMNWTTEMKHNFTAIGLLIGRLCYFGVYIEHDIRNNTV